MTYLRYAALLKTLATARRSIDRPLTLAEKILASHMVDPSSEFVRGQSYLKLRPDRIAMQDASAQTAILQFMLAGKHTTAVPTSVHCDHLIVAKSGAERDLEESIKENKEVFDFLSSAAKRYGMAFWNPGSGIIHQIVLENYAAPGALILGTDSHTPNAGGLGCIAVGVGGADAVDGMAGIPWEIKAPKILGVHLTGELNPWASPKDMILNLADKLTVKGGTNHIIEYFGPGVKTLSCTGMATICNMGAEVGATSSIFPYNEAMARYLDATNRIEWRKAADHARREGLLSSDANAHYDRIVEMNLDDIEPTISGPFSPDRAIPLSKAKSVFIQNNWPLSIDAGLIGSCTNSSYEDMTKASSIARQASSRGIKAQSKLFVTPGSEQIRATTERDGQTASLSSVGGVVLANACGPCIGQWNRTEKKKEPNVILSSFNRNFRGRNDGNLQTMNFLASPEIVTALAIAGTIDFHPAHDTLMDGNGKEFKLKSPIAVDLPTTGFVPGRTHFRVEENSVPTASVQVVIKDGSERLQRLTPFEKWHGQEFENLAVLIKVKGKCTTDHISAAGPWLKYKGHLENLAENTLIGATSAFTGDINSTWSSVTNRYLSIPAAAREYKEKGQGWVVVADENYGEGSAREHAALQPRFLGCKMIIARSFARIHETNLKKQGILPFTFEDPHDYEKIGEKSVITTIGLESLNPSSKIKARVQDITTGQECTIILKHTLSRDQIEWFKAGSALNMIAASNM